MCLISSFDSMSDKLCFLMVCDVFLVIFLSLQCFLGFEMVLDGLYWL